MSWQDVLRNTLDFRSSIQEKKSGQSQKEETSTQALYSR